EQLSGVSDEMDNDGEVVAGTVEVYLSTVNNNLSVIMKRLTGVTVILAGIGAVAGIFGMSEAGAALGNGESGGFWVITLMVVLGAAVTAVVLRRIGWTCGPAGRPPGSARARLGARGRAETPRRS